MMDFLRMFACGLLLAVGCGKPAAGPDAPGGGGDGPGGGGDGPGGGGDGPGGPAVDAALLDVPGHTPGMPGLGAHAMNFYRVGESTAPSISTPPRTTQSAGGTIVVCVGRGNNDLFTLPPTDNKGNTPYQLQGAVEPYVHPNEFSGTALYAFTSARGGSDFSVSTTTGKAMGGSNSDEVSIVAVEVIEGTQIQDFAWNEVVQDSSKPPALVTSKSVTTTGPATLIAFWWGDLSATVDQTAVADGGFVVVESALFSGSMVQFAAAVKNVTQAGTYNVTWTATPLQGAQLWLIAVQ